MKLLMAIMSLVPLAAQQPPPDAKPAAASETASPVPASESWLAGSIDLGYRGRTNVAGSLDTYRSVVNLGSGPKLLGAEFTLTDPKRRIFDEVRVRAYSWGDDPYATFHLSAKKAKLYDFSSDYRDIAYFNYLPSYADPLLGRGIVLNEQSFDTRRRFAAFELDLLPGNWFIPYLAYDRASGSGTGVAAFVSDANEFPVPNRLRDETNLYKGGVRFELRRFHATVEEGGTAFKDDQSLYQAAGPQNFGNSTNPFLGQTLYLSNLLGAYGIRGTSFYSRALMTANLTSWLDLYGQFLFSQPDSSIHYQQSDNGNLVLQSQLLFYNGQQYLVSAAAKLPHTSASFGGELRPLRRVRVIESWLTDRLHEGGTSTSVNQLFTAPNRTTQITALLASSLATNYSQQQTDLFFDVTQRLTLRGAYRYVWGEAGDTILPPAGLASADRGKLRRNVAIGGVTFRPSQRLSISGEAEGASTGGTYFRTSLYDYQKVGAPARYQAAASLSLSADFSLLNNKNPLPGVDYDYLANQNLLAFLWSPGGGKTWEFQGSYSRSTLRSAIGYLSPQDLQPQQSLYRDNAHTATALVDLKVPGISGFAPKITAGGSFFISFGSRPTSYYQPIAKLWLPFGKNVAGFAEWRYFGYGEAFYLYEGFRTQMVTAGLRLTR